MHRLLNNKTRLLAAYVPGEQPRDMRYIKLNTNECPYPPSPCVQAAIAAVDADSLRLYPDPTSEAVCCAVADQMQIKREQVFIAGGSDEALAFAFMAYMDVEKPVRFANITYGFYTVYAELLGVPYTQIPLRDGFTLDPADYINSGDNIVIANPNAPTGICLPLSEIERIVAANPDSLVLVDEAYIDFAREESAVKLIDKYDNLLVVRTFSKSRALAGMRIGCAFGCAGLIAGLEKIKFSFNPYNMDRLSCAVAIAAIQDENCLRETVDKITATRERVTAALNKIGFTTLPSQANFIFTSPPDGNARDLYAKLRQSGILVRYFDKPAIDAYLRVSIGTDDEMDAFLAAVRRILEEQQ